MFEGVQPAAQAPEERVVQADVSPLGPDGSMNLRMAGRVFPVGERQRPDRRKGKAMFHHDIRHVAVGLAAGVAVIGLLAGCASDPSGSTPSSVFSAAAGSLVVPTVAPGPVLVTAATGPLGIYLVDGAGRTLYLFEADTGRTSSCIADCADQWPPLIVIGSPTAAAAASGDKLATAPRADGSLQVQYAGHPLYYFAGDQTAGQTSGEGMDGQWWIVGPAGGPIRSGPDGEPDGGTDGMPGGGY
jgi:predicted lipoprotein with Yx(FWY)xxD motif